MNTPFLSKLSNGMQYQLQIYFAGMQNKKPLLPVSYEALEQKAREAMKPEAFAYIAGGAGAETTMQNNIAAFNRWQIVPRVMQDVARRSIAVELFGTTLPSPLLLGPVGVLSIAHPDA